MALIQIRIDDGLKNQAASIFSKTGLNLSTAIRLFFKKTVVEGGLPFDPEIDSTTFDAIRALDKMRSISGANGNSEMTLDEINEEIRAARQERKNNL